MMSEELRALVRYRLDQAEQSLRDARMLLSTHSCNAAVNRAYYAMFYAILALLCTRGLGTSKHRGAIELFDREFTRTGMFDRELTRWLHEAFDLRQRADYQDLMVVQRERAEETLHNAESFVAQIRKHLSHQWVPQDPHAT